MADNDLATERQIIALDRSKATTSYVDQRIDPLTSALRVADTSVIPPVRAWPGMTRSVTTDGAVCNGTTNDATALADCIYSVGAAGGGTVTIPAGKRMLVKLTGAGAATGIWHPNVTVRGLDDSSEIIFAGSATTDYVSLFRTNASGFRIEDLKITRSAGTYGSFLELADTNANSFAADNVIFDGNSVATNTPEFHGVMLGAATTEVTITNVSFTRCTFKRLPGFALLRPSPAKTSVDGFTVDQCRFDQNRMTDLEFNAPHADTPSVHFARVKVSRSRFTNGRSTDAGKGWGVGFAGVYGASVTGCTFDGYPMEGVHIEDDSRDIIISGNAFRNVARTGSSFNCGVFITSGSHHIAVVGNTFDWSPNPVDAVDGIYDCVYIGTGGAGFAQPHDITVGGNRYRPAPQGSTRPIGLHDAGAVTSFDNTSI